MNFAEVIKNRQEYNRKILKELKDSHPEFSQYYFSIGECIHQYPQQRFGQIVCNYICPDYRDQIPSESTKEFLEFLFPGNPDPFFEESITTFTRLSGQE